jgi:hypothetical protein
MGNEITAHIKSAAAQVARGARAFGRLPQRINRRKLRPDPIVDTLRVRLENEVTGEQDVVGTEKDTAERGRQFPQAYNLLHALHLSSKRYTKSARNDDQSKLRQFALLEANVLYKTFGGIRSDIRVAIDTHLKAYDSHALRTILRNAVHAHYAASFCKTETDDQEPRCELVMKLVVEACLDRLAAMEKLKPLAEHRPKINHAALQYAYEQWVHAPSNALVGMTMLDSFQENIGFIEDLVPGYKAFGRMGVLGSLFDEFEKAIKWRNSEPGFAGERSDDWDERIDEIGRCGAALETIANTWDLYVTARIMQQVHRSYHLAKTPNIETVQSLAAPVPTARDLEWVHDYVLSKDPIAREHNDRRIYDELDRLLDELPTSPVGVMPQRAVPLTDLHPPQRVVQTVRMETEHLLGSMRIDNRWRSLSPVRSLELDGVLTEAPRPQRAVHIKGESGYLLGHKRLGEGDWGPFPLSARPIVDNTRNDIYEELPAAQDRPEIAGAQLRVSKESLGEKELGRANLAPLRSAEPPGPDRPEEADLGFSPEDLARAEELRDRIVAAAERSDIRALLQGLEALSAIGDRIGIDAVFAALADALDSQPASVRENFARLYDALDIAMGRIHEDDPSYRPPAYFAIANALRIGLGEILIVPGGDEELIEAARQLLQEHAEIDALLAEFDRLPPLPRSPRTLPDPDLGEDFDRVEEEIANALVQQTRIDPGSEIAVARLAASQARLEEEELRSVRSSEKPVETTVPSSAPASPQRNARRKPALVRTRGGELQRIVPQDGPANRGLAERMNDDVDRPLRLRPRPAMVSLAAIRDAIDQADVAEFLRALHALAQLAPSGRSERYLAISRTVQSRPPERSNVERLSTLMEAIDKDLRTNSPARERFRPIQRGWWVLRDMAPGLMVAPGSSAVKADLEVAKAFLADPSGMISKPQRNRTNPMTK